MLFDTLRLLLNFADDLATGSFEGSVEIYPAVMEVMTGSVGRLNNLSSEF